MGMYACHAKVGGAHEWHAPRLVQFAVHVSVNALCSRFGARRTICSFNMPRQASGLGRVAFPWLHVRPGHHIAGPSRSGGLPSIKLPQLHDFARCASPLAQRGQHRRLVRAMVHDFHALRRHVGADRLDAVKLAQNALDGVRAAVTRHPDTQHRGRARSGLQ